MMADIIRVKYMASGLDDAERHKLVQAPNGKILAQRITDGPYVIDWGIGNCCCKSGAPCYGCGVQSAFVDGRIRTWGCKFSLHTTLTFTYSLTLEADDGAGGVTTETVSGSRSITGFPNEGINGGSDPSHGLGYSVNGALWMRGSPYNHGPDDDTITPGVPGYYFGYYGCSSFTSDGREYPDPQWGFRDTIAAPSGNGWLQVGMTFRPANAHCAGLKKSDLWYSLDAVLQSYPVASATKHDGYLGIASESYLGTDPDTGEDVVKSGVQYRIISIEDISFVTDSNKCKSFQFCGDYNKADFCASISLSIGGMVYTIYNYNADGSPGVFNIDGNAGPLVPLESSMPSYNWHRPYDYYLAAGSAPAGTPNAYNDWVIVDAGVDSYRDPSLPDNPCRWRIGIAIKGAGPFSGAIAYAGYISRDENIKGTYDFTGGSIAGGGGYLVQDGDIVTVQNGQVVRRFHVPQTVSIQCNNTIPPYVVPPRPSSSSSGDGTDPHAPGASSSSSVPPPSSSSSSPPPPPPPDPSSSSSGDGSGGNSGGGNPSSSSNGGGNPGTSSSSNGGGNGGASSSSNGGNPGGGNSSSSNGGGGNPGGDSSSTSSGCCLAYNVTFANGCIDGSPQTITFATADNSWTDGPPTYSANYGSPGEYRLFWAANSWLLQSGGGFNSWGVPAEFGTCPPAANQWTASESNNNNCNSVFTSIVCAGGNTGGGGGSSSSSGGGYTSNDDCCDLISVTFAPDTNGSGTKTINYTRVSETVWQSDYGVSGQFGSIYQTGGVWRITQPTTTTDNNAGFYASNGFPCPPLDKTRWTRDSDSASFTSIVGMSCGDSVQTGFDCSRYSDGGKCSGGYIYTELNGDHTDSCFLECCLGLTNPGDSGSFVWDGTTYHYTRGVDTFSGSCMEYIIEVV